MELAQARFPERDARLALMRICNATTTAQRDATILRQRRFRLNHSVVVITHSQQQQCVKCRHIWGVRGWLLVVGNDFGLCCARTRRVRWTLGASAHSNLQLEVCGHTWALNLMARRKHSRYSNDTTTRFANHHGLATKSAGTTIAHVWHLSQ